jgi:beta-glucosidase
VTFKLDQDDFALLDDKLKRVVEAGTFTVFVGGSSSTDNHASFEVTATTHLPGLGPAIPRALR